MTISCAGCGLRFVPSHGNQSYCTTRCRDSAADMRSGRVRRGPSTPTRRCVDCGAVIAWLVTSGWPQMTSSMCAHHLEGAHCDRHCPEAAA